MLEHADHFCMCFDFLLKKMRVLRQVKESVGKKCFPKVNFSLIYGISLLIVPKHFIMDFSLWAGNRI